MRQEQLEGALKYLGFQMKTVERKNRKAFNDLCWPCEHREQYRPGKEKGPYTDAYVCKKVVCFCRMEDCPYMRGES